MADNAMPDDQITRWYQELSDPKQRDAAADRIVSHFVRQLLGLIRQNLTQRMQSRVEPEDIMQSVWGSFFRRDFSLENRDELLRFLARICINKTRSAARRHSAQQRDIGREVHSEVEELQTMVAGANSDQAAIALELVEELPDELQDVLAWRVEGLTVDEIALKIGRTKRTVNRRVERIRSRFQRYLEAEGE